MAEHPTYSIVVEMENAKFIDWDEVGAGLKALAREVAAVSAEGFARPKVIISHGGPEVDATVLRDHIDAEAPQLGEVAEVSFAAQRRALDRGRRPRLPGFRHGSATGLARSSAGAVS